MKVVLVQHQHQQMRYAHGLIYHTNHTVRIRQQQQQGIIQIATSPWPKDKKISRKQIKNCIYFGHGHGRIMFFFKVFFWCWDLSEWNQCNARKDVSAIDSAYKHKLFEFWHQILPISLFVLISF